jgi:Flp pilus assembly pilin Flp
MVFGQPGGAVRRRDGAGESGQDLVEYALLSGFIAVTIGALLPMQMVPAICQIFSRLHMIMVTNFNGA